MYNNGIIYILNKQIKKKDENDERKYNFSRLRWSTM